MRVFGDLSRWDSAAGEPCQRRGAGLAGYEIKDASCGGNAYASSNDASAYDRPSCNGCPTEQDTVVDDRIRLHDRFGLDDAVSDDPRRGRNSSLGGHAKFVG